MINELQNSSRRALRHVYTCRGDGYDGISSLCTGPRAGPEAQWSTYGRPTAKAGVSNGNDAEAAAAGEKSE